MKYYTIKENHLFSKAYKKGRKAVTENITVYVLPDYHANRLQRAHPLKLRINRVGFTTAKKLGGAVVRNRTRRIMREAYYMINKNHRTKKGSLIIFCARDHATGVKTDDIYRDMVYALRKLDIVEDQL